MKVNSVMSSEVQCCNVNTSLNDIAAKMWEFNCGSIPVVDEESRPVGMVTDRDIAMCCTLNHKAPWELDASTITDAGGVYSCVESDTVQNALAIMKENKVRRLPVTSKEGYLVGMLSLDDIISKSSNGKSAHAIPYDMTMKTLKSVAIHH